MRDGRNRNRSSQLSLRGNPRANLRQVFSHDAAHVLPCFYIVRMFFFGFWFYVSWLFLVSSCSAIVAALCARADYTQLCVSHLTCTAFAFREHFCFVPHQLLVLGCGCLAPFVARSTFLFDLSCHLSPPLRECVGVPLFSILSSQ